MLNQYHLRKILTM